MELRKPSIKDLDERSCWFHFVGENQARADHSVEPIAVGQGGSYFFRSSRDLLRTGRRRLGRNQQSFFFLNGRSGQPEGGPSALRLYRGEKSGFQTTVGIGARFLHRYQSGGLW